MNLLLQSLFHKYGISVYRATGLNTEGGRRTWIHIHKYARNPNFSTRTDLILCRRHYVNGLNLTQLTLKHIQSTKPKKSPKVIIGFISEAVPDENVTPQCVWISDISLFLSNTGGLTWYSCLLLNLTPLKNNNLSTKAGWWLWSHNKRCFVSGHCKVCRG